MLNELLDIFLGMYYEYIPADYPNRDYFTSIIAVVVTAVMLVGSFAVIIAVIKGTFSIIRGWTR